MEPLPLRPEIGKADATAVLAEHLGSSEFNPWGSGVAALLQEALENLGPSSNNHVEMIDSADCEGCDVTTIFGASTRVVASPHHFRDSPDCFPAAGGATSFSPPLRMATLQNGSVCNFADAPVVFDAANRVVANFSSKYHKLIYFYDQGVDASMENIRHIDGDALVLLDDIKPLNFCHWILDALPRICALENLGLLGDAYVITPPITTEFQRSSLEACGIESDRIVEIGDFETVTARQLIVTDDITEMPHPAFKAAPWAVEFLKSKIGLSGALHYGAGGKRIGDKIYVSRGDAGGRRMLNEPQFLTMLQRYGFESIQLSAMPLSDQAAVFAKASHVVALHGAGLSNLVFSSTHKKIIEIFPHTYGTPAYYTIAANHRDEYATYVTHNVSRSIRDQLDDVILDVDSFEDECQEWLI